MTSSTKPINPRRLRYSPVTKRMEIIVPGEQEIMRNMNSMKKTKLIAIAIVSVATLIAPIKAAETKEARLASKMTKKLSAIATRASGKLNVEQQLLRYTHYYNLNDEDQARIKKILTAQQKDIADFKKIYGPKIAAVDEQIKKLQDEIRELQKSKSAQLKVLEELKLDHKAELDEAITAEQKTVRLIAYLKRYDTVSFWKFLPEEIQAALDRQCQAAAMELVSTGTSESHTALRGATLKMRAAIEKSLTPEVRQEAETKQVQEYVMRSFARCELTGDQKARIGELCAKGVKDKIAISAQYNQLNKDIVALRHTMSKYKGSIHAYTIRSEVVEKILTEEQRKRLPGKYRTATKKDKKNKSNRKRSKEKSTT